MKKILIILITIPLIFGSCEKEDDSPNSNSNNGNNPIGNTSTGTTGYIVEDYNDKLYKTTNSGSTWVEVTDFYSITNGSFSPTSISFIN